MNKFHNIEKFNKIKCFINFTTKCGAFFYHFELTKNAMRNYPFLALAKSSAERDNSNLYKANKSTPLNRAIFVCKLNTPKENALGVLLSMVAFSGQRLIVGCVPCIAVCHPAKRYRPSVTTQAVTSINLYKETPPMIYLFLGINRQHLADTGLTLNTFPRSRLAIQADDEQTARAKLAKNWLLLQAWQFQNRAEIDRTFAKEVIYA